MRSPELSAVFLDRDGVINEDRDDYVKSIRELKVFEFAPRAIRMLNDAGWPVFVVSNQQAVAKGLMTTSELAAIDAEIAARIEAEGGRINGFYYCPHHASERCDCRKPRPGLLLRAAREHNIDLGSSVMVGDSERDIQAGREVGCTTILVLTGAITEVLADNLSCKPDAVTSNLLTASELIVRGISGCPRAVR